MKKTFTKSDLIRAVYKNYKNLTRNQAKRAVDCIFDSLTKALSNKKRVEVRGFGTFGLKSYPARMGKNPQTGESIHIKSKTLPFFRAGKIRQGINKSNRADAD